jgi:hypothetical protein
MTTKRASSNIFVEEIAGRAAAIVLASIKPELLLSEPPVDVVRPAEVPVDVRPKTVAEFCKANKISRSTYVKNRPREMRIGRTIRITAEAENEWRRKAQGVAKSARSLETVDRG